MTHAEFYKAYDQNYAAENKCVYGKYLESVGLDQPVNKLYSHNADRSSHDETYDAVCSANVYVRFCSFSNFHKAAEKNNRYAQYERILYRCFSGETREQSR